MFGRIIGLFSLLIFTIGVQGQPTTLTVGMSSSAPSTASECTSVFIGRSVQLSASATCDVNIEIMHDLGPNITSVGNIIDTIMASPYTLTFDSLGVYSFICASKERADQCFHVLPEPIPTIGQWGLISLTILLLIVGVVAIKSRQVSIASNKKH